MRYPGIDAYLAAMQVHRRSVRDPVVAGGRVELNSWGSPLARSGTFALTFKVSGQGRDYAFRCFQRERPGMHERYAAIHRALSSSPLPYFVDFAYLDPGIVIDGHGYPAIRMDWAQGQALGAFIEASLGRPDGLRAVQQQLRDLALAMEGAGIAHGDVQLNNLLVGPSGELKVVDYDGMFVPQLGPMGALESGHRNFQHPQRERLAPFDATLDRFSFAVLHAGLSALVENPSLWAMLKADPESLLLRATDFADPTASSAFAMLCGLPASGQMYRWLRSICAAPYQQVPTFSDFLAGRNVPGSTSVRNSAAGPPPPPNPGPTSPGKPTSTRVLNRYQTARPVVDATNTEDCLRLKGHEVEVIGKVESVKMGRALDGYGYVHFKFGPQKAHGFKVVIRSSGLSELHASSLEPGHDWVGTWVSATGTLVEDQGTWGRSPVIDIEHAPQLQRLNPLQARWRLTTWAAPASPGIPVTASLAGGSGSANQARLASLQSTSIPGAPSSGVKSGVAAPSNTPASPPPPPVPQGVSNKGAANAELRKLLWILLGVGLLALLIALLASRGNGGAPSAAGSGDASTNIETVAAPQPVESEPTASDQLHTCWAESASDPSVLEPVDCGFSGADFRVSRVATSASLCSGEWLKWNPSSVLCLEEWPLKVYETCFQPEGESEQCGTGLQWTYEGCWNVGKGAVLQAWRSGSWISVKEDIATKDDCMPDYPWTVRFTQKSAGVGSKKYRLRFPPQGEYGETIEQIAVTVREK